MAKQTMTKRLERLLIGTTGFYSVEGLSEYLCEPSHKIEQALNLLFYRGILDRIENDKGIYLYKFK